MNLKYLYYELLRLWRNKPFFFFSLVFPIALYLVFAGTMGDSRIPMGTGNVKLSLYYMAAMAGYGALMAALSGGARIASERATGWDRQLRLTGLAPAQYLLAKVLTAYVMSLLSMLLIFAAGSLFGAHVDGVGRWFLMGGLILVGVLPFAVLGIFLGLVLPTEAMGPVLGGGGAFFGFLGGMWFPFSSGSVMDSIGKLFPSYWISQASMAGVMDTHWPVQGWLVVASWTLSAVAAAFWAYGRDQEKV